MEINDNIEYQKPKTMKGKGGRKPKVEAGEIIEKVVPRDEVVQEVSYTKGREMKEKRPMSDKQKQNIDKLILLNAERKAQRDAEKKRVLEEEEQRKKVVVVKTIVREKRPYIRHQQPPAQCRKEEVKQAPKKDFDPYPDEEPIQTADESTDTQTIKKLERKVKRIEKVEKVIDKPFDKIKAMQNMIF
jgi:hypothetical protein